MRDAGKQASKPLRLALVYTPGIALTDAQAMLIDRLSASGEFRLVGKLAGQKPTAMQRPPFPLRWVLAAERYIMRRRIAAYDTAAATDRLAELSEISHDSARPAYDVALALSDSTLAQEQLQQARVGEVSVTYEGSATPDWIGTCRTVFTAPNVRVDIVLRAAGKSSGRTLRRAAYNPKPGAVLTGAFVAEKTVLLLLRTLKDLQSNPDLSQDAAEPLPPGAPSGYADLLPYLASFLSTACERLARRLPGKLARPNPTWRIMSGASDPTDITLRDAWDLPNNAYFMADPFLFEHDGETWIFYEAMGPNDSNGWIEAARLGEGTLSPSVVALKRPYHLSYPYVFRDGNDIFMLPETQQQMRLEVWKAKTFPTEWELHATAFEGEYLADSSLFRAEDGQCWLLTNLSDHYAFQDHSSELYLFAVDGPDLTTIVPHPQNPVVIGSDVARNAGSVIRTEARIFRPSQNNSFGVYGYGLNIMEITRLDPVAYEERLVRTFTPKDKPGSIGLHHLHMLRDRYVIDWCTTTPDR
ncbi:glucosamine inositolphosphorylceramide transferase family protein [Roseovarius sp. B08]|uniref:glucosamine inositolphosphorylceramide transferase family protein n=1 Tax=Roseovarius sp. B08 TaxID=3449223 RepID=UPI003EDC49B2